MPKRPTCRKTDVEAPQRTCISALDMVSHQGLIKKLIDTYWTRSLIGTSFGVVALGITGCTDTYNMTYNTYYGDEYYSVPVISPTSIRAQRPAAKFPSAAGQQIATTASLQRMAPKPAASLPNPTPKLSPEAAGLILPESETAIEHMPEVVIASPLPPLERPTGPTASEAPLDPNLKSAETPEIQPKGGPATSEQAAVIQQGRTFKWRTKQLDLPRDIRPKAESDAGVISEPQPQELPPQQASSSVPKTPSTGASVKDADEIESEGKPTQVAAIQDTTAPSKVPAANPKLDPASRPASKSTPSEAAPKTGLYGRYEVGAGDTSFSIAKRHNMTVDELADLNKLGADYGVYKGQSLKVRKSAPSDTAIVEPQKGQQKPQNRREALSKIKPPQRSGDKLAWPVTGKVVERFGSKPDGRYSEGVKLSTSSGSPVRAAENGVVFYRDRLDSTRLKSYGQVVIIKHSGGQATVYSGIDQVVPKVGDIVRRGDIIGQVGETKELMFIVSDHEGKMSDPLQHLERRKS